MGWKGIFIVLTAVYGVFCPPLTGNFVFLNGEGVFRIANDIKVPELPVPEVSCNTPPAH